MEINKIIKTRRAIRKFSDQPVPEQTLKIILEAGHLAPSSKNSQPVKFIIIRDKEKLRMISDCTYSGDFLPLAPVGIAVITKDAKLPETDAARAIQNMVLQAWELNIGTCWITNFWGDKVKQILKVPSTGNYRLITVMPFGYPHSDVVKPKGKRQRKSYNDVVYTEEYGKHLSL
ncbi:MAG: nitroreductase family protein [Candidatus Hodarchaeales archaeon]|jgi:nitroreductase